MSHVQTIEEGEKYGVHAVFTPTTQAKVNFVERNKELTNTFVDAIETPGKQVVVFGESGSGKSTFVKNKLEQVGEDAYVLIDCSRADFIDKDIVETEKVMRNFQDFFCLFF